MRFIVIYLIDQIDGFSRRRPALSHGERIRSIRLRTLEVLKFRTRRIIRSLLRRGVRMISQDSEFLAGRPFLEDSFRETSHPLILAAKPTRQLMQHLKHPANERPVADGLAVAD